jgi:nicotinamidase-related amidase
VFPEFYKYNTQITHVRRHGEVSAWENPDYVRAVYGTGKRTLIMSGIWTSVCVVFPAVQARAEGFNVYAVMDASGDISAMASSAAQTRMAQAGVIITSTNVVIAEIMRSWNRSDAMDYAALFSEVVPNYQLDIDSYQAAQNAKTCP